MTHAAMRRTLAIEPGATARFEPAIDRLFVVLSVAFLATVLVRTAWIADAAAIELHAAITRGDLHALGLAGAEVKFPRID